MDQNRTVHECVPLHPLDLFSATRSESDGRRSVVLLALARARVCSAPWQRSGGAASSHLPAGFNGSHCNAFNARRASSPGSRRVTCSRRPPCSHGSHGHPMLRAVALCHPRYLSSLVPSLASFTHHQALASTRVACSSSNRLVTPLPPLPHLGLLVKAVTLGSPLSDSCFFGFLLAQ